MRIFRAAERRVLEEKCQRGRIDAAVGCAQVERQLRDDARLSDDQIAACFASVADDPGSLDLKQVIYE